MSNERADGFLTIHALGRTNKPQLVHWLPFFGHNFYIIQQISVQKKYEKNAMAKVKKKDFFIIIVSQKNKKVSTMF